MELGPVVGILKAERRKEFGFGNKEDGKGETVGKDI